MTRDEWYAVQHTRRLLRRHWRLCTEEMQKWAEAMVPVIRRVYAAFEPLLLVYQRQRLIETLAKVRDHG